MIGQIIAWDLWFSAFIQSYSHIFFDSLMAVISFFGDPIFWLMAAAYLFWKGKENYSFHLMNVVLLVAVVVGLVKPLVGRLRPDPAQFRRLMGSLTEFSFPSGHTTLASAMYVYILPCLKKNKKIILGLGVLAVGLSRIYLGMHFLSDVLAALVFGAVIGTIGHKLKKYWVEHHFKLTKIEDEVGLLLIIVLSLIGLLFMQKLALLGLLLGFYGGFFLWKEQNYKISKLQGTQLTLKFVAGYLWLELFLLTALTAQTQTIQFILFLIAGFWVSFLFPWSYEQILAKQKKKKRRKRSF